MKKVAALLYYIPPCSSLTTSLSNEHLHTVWQLITLAHFLLLLFLLRNPKRCQVKYLLLFEYCLKTYASRKNSSFQRRWLCIWHMYCVLFYFSYFTINCSKKLLPIIVLACKVFMLPLVIFMCIISWDFHVYNVMWLVYNVPWLLYV